MRRMQLCLLVMLAVSSPAIARGVAQPAPVAARSANMLADIEWLAGPELDGRLTGSDGNAAAARALAARLGDLGGEPVPGADSLLHSYGQPVVRVVEQPRMLLQAPGGATDGGAAIVRFDVGTDFDILVREGTRSSGPLTARVVRLTKENATREWIREHQDAALVISSELFGNLTRNNRLMQALFHPSESPAAVIIGMPEGMGTMPRSLFLTGDDYPPVGPMLVQMTHEATERLLSFLAAGSPQATITVHGGYVVETATITNVAAVFPASTPLTTEPAPHAPPIVLSAHFDGPGRLAESWHYPGAIDNASGVAVILEVVRILAEIERSGSSPVWVVFFNGEEQGMWGSRAFVSEHGEQLLGARIVNVDMAGLRDVPVSVTRTADAAELAARAAKRLAERELEAHVNDGGGSDHLSFAGVAPAVSLVQSPYRQMHRPTDTPENSDGRTLEAIARAVFELVAGEVVDLDASTGEASADDLD